MKRRTHVLLTMKVLNRNRKLAAGCPMRGVRALIVCFSAALALSGCVQTASGVASAPPSDLDFMAYGRPQYAATAAAAPDSRGAIGAVRSSYAAAPLPPSRTTPYRLDAGDKLRVVVYGQE